MSNATSFVGSVPENYHRSLGPIFFEAYADELSTRLAKLAPAQVLETACGTGIVTRRLRERLPAATRLVATEVPSTLR